MIPPLLIKDISLRYFYNDMEVREPGLVGKLDTAAGMTAVPIEVAQKMKLPSAGFTEKLTSFDQSIEPKRYPKFHAECFIPKLGWTGFLQVIGCQRDDVLLGRDICSRKLLIADWRWSKFGLCHGNLKHRLLHLAFKRLGKISEK